MSSKTLRQYQRIIDSLAEQGCKVRTTPEGWFILFPDGGGTSLHLTHSDGRALPNFKAKVQRHGLVWPAGIELPGGRKGGRKPRARRDPSAR